MLHSNVSCPFALDPSRRQ